ncbi:hypothetical protein BC936DRAFT_144799 [Jimgerdemannia flammicorona]|uniref:MOSC domain-containing protein n=1 Tax=Jimgerdemannia flammicorona TaxID=994334 RepID=A0A433DBP0_9FUNG|nr:hypothetical protein BC936DRAFT_144799 [Jimgerdemannia flammicorona]
MPTLTGISIFPVKSCHSVEIQECDVDALGLLHDRRFMFIDAETNRFITQRKYASMTLIRPTINLAAGTLDFSGPSVDPISVPLQPDISSAPKLRVRIWNDIVDAYDMGDAAAGWVIAFFAAHASHDGANLLDDEAVEVVRPREIRLVRVVDIAKGYTRPAHPKIPGVHTPFSDASPVSFGYEASMVELNRILEEPEANGVKIPINRFRNNLTIAGTEPWEEDQWLVIRIGVVTFYVVCPIDRCIVPGIDQETGLKDSWGSPGPLGVLKQHRALPEKPGAGFFCSHVIPLTSGKVKIGDEVEVLERIPSKNT